MTRRTDRLGELFRQEISLLLTNGLKDPRIGFATISHVEVTEDLSFAKVFVSVMGDDKDKQDTLIGLRQSASFLRSKISRQVKIRKMPALQFVLDDSLDHSQRVDEILAELKKAGDLGDESGASSEG